MLISAHRSEISFLSLATEYIFAKPIDEKIISLFYDKKSIITVEEHSLACGFGSAVLELAAKKSFENKARFGPHNMGKIVTIGGPDEFINIGSRSTQLD